MAQVNRSRVLLLKEVILRHMKKELIKDSILIHIPSILIFFIIPHSAFHILYGLFFLIFDIVVFLIWRRRFKNV